MLRNPHAHQHYEMWMSRCWISTYPCAFCLLYLSRMITVLQVS